MAIINGTSGNDTRVGTAFVDTINGLAGNDQLSGLADNDRLNGGLGNDVLNGGAGIGDIADYSSGSINGQSYIGATAGVTVNLNLTGAQNTGGAGSDTLLGIETVIGTTFNDVLTGNSVRNALYGLSGQDVLNGGLGDDVLNGGIGNDVLNGGAGIDTADYSALVVSGLTETGATGGVTVNLNLTGAQNTGGAGSDTLVGIEQVIGTSFNDTLTGNSDNNLLSGRGGNDTVNGGSGHDQLSGGLGNDLLIGGSGDDTLNGFSGNDVLNGGDGIDTASYLGDTAGVNVDLNVTSAQSTGGSGVDTLSSIENVSGTAWQDRLIGNGANNVLAGLGGNDLLNGGAGSDRFMINNGDGWDTIYYGQQSDRIVFNGTTLQGTATYTGNGEYSLLGYKIWQHGYSLEITSPDGKTSMEAQQFFTSSNGVYFDTTNMGITVPGIYKSTGTPKTYTGTEQNDFINIVGGPNIINGLGGNDQIYVYHYSSTIDGGAGNDYISGSGATDTLNGGLGDDVILSNGGLDTIHGGSGNDRIYSDGGEQKIFGDAGFDIVDYAGSQAMVEVNLALTTRQDGWTYNYAYGDILSDIEGVSGTGWGDTLIGDSGNNLLIGRGGADTLTGGAGVDVFKYIHPNGSGGADIGPTAATSDVITDFANGIDKIDLSDFAGTFSFRGTGAFTGIAHEVNYAKVANNTFIGLDIDGNKTLDAQIQLVGLHTMTANDFVL